MEQQLPMGAESGSLLVAAKAGAHSRRHDQKRGMHGCASCAGWYA